MKLKIIVGLLVLTLILTVKIFIYPSLNNVSINPSNKVSEKVSPDKRYILNVYLYGGVLLKSDYSYIAELVDTTTSSKKNILWLKPTFQVVQWADNNTLLIDDKTINIHNQTYDFRWD